VTDQRGKVGRMKAKKSRKSQDIDIPNPLKVDEEEFKSVVRKMVRTPPETLKEVVERRRNPETDPRYLPVFPEFEPKKQKKKT